MKNFILGIIATGVMVFNSNAQKIDIKNRDNYGAIHNQLIDAFKAEGKSYSKYATKEDYLNDIYLLASSRYPEVRSGADMNGLQQNFFRTFKSPDLDSNINSNLQRLYDTKKISKVVFDNAKMIAATKSYPRAIEAIQEMEKMNLSSTDVQAIQIFKSILNASHQYWGTTAGKALRYCTEIADALGGLIWFYTGPFSIVAGLAYSIAVNEAGACR